MNCYLLLLQYQVPVEQIMEVVADHRGYLTRFYEKGTILFSGIRHNREGGVIILKANSEEEVEEIAQNDPFFKKNLVTYEIIGFEARQYQEWLSNWLFDSTF